MRSRLLPLLLLPLLSACFSTEHPVITTATDRHSHVLAFRRTAVMDTITTILEGEVVSLCNQQPVPAAVQLTTGGATYQAVAALNGRFRFFHIPAGDYTLTTTCPPYDKLAGASIHLSTGDVVATTIGMGCHSGRKR